MGIIVQIYKSPLGDCTNNGISSRVDELCIVNIPGEFSPKVGRPAALIKKRRTVGNVVIVPCDSDGNELPGHSMFGGNFAYGDSTFGDVVKNMSGYEFTFPVAIHDRYER